MAEKITARHITRLYRAAGAEHVAAGENWYRDAYLITAALAERHGRTVEDVAGVIAALSPLRGWGDNVNIAARAVAAGSLTGGAFKNSIDKVNRILAGEHPGLVLSGNKVRAFWRCIASAGQTTAVCVDRHAYDAAVNTRHTDETRPRLSDKRYREVADAYVRAAEIISRESGRLVTPSAVQATVWLVWRARYWSAGAFDSHTVEL